MLQGVLQPLPRAEGTDAAVGSGWVPLGSSAGPAGIPSAGHGSSLARKSC